MVVLYVDNCMNHMVNDNVRFTRTHHNINSDNKHTFCKFNLGSSILVIVILLEHLFNICVGIEGEDKDLTRSPAG